MPSLSQLISSSRELLRQSIGGFLVDECYSKASALSFYTLLSIVPLLAIAFGIAKGFGFERLLEVQILETFYQHKEVAEKIISFARSTLERTQGSLIAGAGVLMLFWTSFSLIGSLEKALNAIWKFGEIRPLQRRMIDYLPILIFTPIFVVASSSLTFFLVNKLVEVFIYTGIYEVLKPLIYALYYGLLLAITWAFYSFIYLYLPLKRPPWNASIFAGLLAACAFQLIQWGYVHLQILLTSYNAIYGSLAAIPLFLLWLQASWLIVLAAAEVAYQSTNQPLLSSSTTRSHVNASKKELLIMTLLVVYRHYHLTNLLESPIQLAKELGLSPHLASMLLEKCLSKGLILEVLQRRGIKGFIPLIDASDLTFQDVLLVESDSKTYPIQPTSDYEKVSKFLKVFQQEASSLPSNLSFRALATLV